MRKKFLVYLLIFIVSYAIYFLTSPKTTPYNYYVRLADAFIHLRPYLLNHPSWLNELIPLGGKYYVVYPPMPSILLVPFVFFFGSNFSQTLFSLLLGSVNPVILFEALRKAKFNFKVSLLATIFFAFGTNYWFLTTVGSAWYLAHVVGLFFLLLAILETFGKQRLFFIGLLLGASFWARTTIIFTLPFFLFFMRDKFWPVNRKALYNLAALAMGIGIFIFLDCLYNYLRFGSINPVSPYTAIPKSQRPESLRNGFLSIKNIPMQLGAIFLSLPHFQKNWPYVIPSLYSLAIWFTSPAIIFILKAKKSILMLSSWAAILPTFFVISLWTVVGYSQFGYRFAQDFMPFIIILFALGISPKPNRLSYILVILSIAINLWGVILINFLNLWVI